MNLRAAVELFGGGTSEGAVKGWETRRRGGPRGEKVWRLPAAHRFASNLGKVVPGARFRVVGSVQKKGRSKKDLDVLVDTDESYDHEVLLSSMKRFGYSWMGTATVSPAEAQLSRKRMRRGWSEIEQFQNTKSGHWVDFWFKG